MCVQIALHLGDFMVRLRSNPLALYEYCPIPPITYPELEAELYCHRCYLRHLCDETRFADWPIPQPVSLMQAVLSRWADEMARTPSSLTRVQALEALELPPDVPVNETDATLRRAYLRLAAKYHPGEGKARADALLPCCPAALLR
jgi:DnaJ family protein C protein 13